uniref:hypothetical protein n=1 Tax=uncultured Erythrobacter sp. TaxID=263913 RepID=UPI00262D7D82|nr:hypothetical protein [uncultured Erythrobacter sp.]
MRAILEFRPARAAILGSVLGLGVIGAFAATNTAAAISSNVYIDARETFVLGGKQPGAFTVKGQNKGKVTVEVLAQSDGDATLIATIAPGERFKQGFAKGEGALLRNTSTDARAHVKVRVTGTTKNLGMGYEGW